MSDFRDINPGQSIGTEIVEVRHFVLFALSLEVVSDKAGNLIRVSQFPIH